MKHFRPSKFLYLFFVVIIIFGTNQCTNNDAPKILPVDEAYKPDQPIEFPHDLHAGKLKIDCNYCHNDANDGKKEGIQAATICMECHKKVNGNSSGK